jgi:hypothetical protein
MPDAAPAAAGPFVQTFAPESWGEAEKFVRFAPYTYEFKEAQARALEGVVGHFRKAAALNRVARRLEEGLALDREEARTQGYSDARRSEEFAAVVEEVFGELYACLDCTRQVLKAVYAKAQGIPKDKTSRLFENAASGRLDSMVPDAIRLALVQAHDDWFGDLRRIRTAVTHLSPGDCSPGEEEGKVAYFNRALGSPGNSLEIADVWGETERYFAAVNDLLGSVFHELNSTLADQRVQKVCGFYDGRVYQRSVSPVEARDFDSGDCVSYEWFEKDESPTCPMSATCGAYARAGRPAHAGK